MVQLFSVPIFFIMFRECLEASVIVSVLLSLVEGIVKSPDKFANSATLASVLANDSEKLDSTTSEGSEPVDPAVLQRRLLRKLRIQIFAGTACGLAIALAIGAAFLTVYYVKLSDLYAQTEDLWEGIFSLIACIMIFVMALAMLRMDRAKARWKHKLAAAFHTRPSKLEGSHHQGGRASKWALFILPMITVLREGLEACIFVGGVSLGQPATSIPIAAVVGLLCGIAVGLLIYFGSAKINVSYFLVFSTCFLLLIGSGLFSKAVGDFQTHYYVTLVGADLSEEGDGPGSYDPNGMVWHLTYGNPENNTAGQGWSIFNALLGWTNTATIGTILSYVFYWLAVIVALVWMKWQEGRFSFMGRESATAKRRRARRAEKELKSSTHVLPILEKQESGDDEGEIMTASNEEGSQSQAEAAEPDQDKVTVLTE